MPKGIDGKYYFIINVNRTTLEQVRVLAVKQGYKLTGDSGEFSNSGVDFKFNYMESTDSLIITILDKSIVASMFSDDYVETKVREVFTKVIGELHADKG